jgi:signal transduction histidine kinase
VGGEPHLLCVIKDITEQKALQNEMLKLDRLHLVGEMAASIGHEIRNPMTSVRGYLQLLEDKYSEDKEVLDLMIEELDQANSIITDYLSLAKNKLVELRPRNLNAVMQGILPQIEANARIQGKTIKLEMDPTPYLLLDEKEIKQLILNLVNNGLESMSLSGIVTIKIYLEGDTAVLSIHDQGCGIQPADLDKLGIPFFTTKQKGIGLGLAVCYGIAKRHNARIDAQTSSRGTIIYVRFPVDKDQPATGTDQGASMSF